MNVAIYQVDAFTHRPFHGNPAAVCLLEQPVAEDWMRLVAREMNLSETAFLSPRKDDSYDLRWFTPSVEVDLCGHATLASSHVLWESGCLDKEAAARFHTRSGLLTCTQKGDWIEMDFPARLQQPAALPSGLIEAAGLAGHTGEIRYTGRFAEDYLIEVESEQLLRSLEPDPAALNRVSEGWPRVRAFIVTCLPATAGYDFVSRFFAPGSGIPEDPVTGSAHCVLAPYWRERLDKEELFAFQASARGGELRLCVKGGRVKLSGQAVTILSGQLAG